MMAIWSKQPSKKELLDARLMCKSWRQVSKDGDAVLDLCYNTLKKWAKHYGIFDKYKNQSGVGIHKPTPRHLCTKKYLYYDEYGNPNYGGGVYVLGLPFGEIRDNFVKKYGIEPYKVGWGKNVEKRTTEVLTKYYREVLPKTKMWEEWKEKARPLSYLKYRTDKEAKMVETALHQKLKDYKIDLDSAREMFDVSSEKLNEIVNVEIGFRVESWYQNKITGRDVVLEVL